MKEISIDEMASLRKIVESIQELIDRYPELQEKLNLKRKFNSVLGEAVGLTKLFEIYKDSAKYKWHGKMQKDYDVIIKKDGKFEKVQIKTSAEESYVFRVAKVKIGNMGDTETIRRAVINEKPVFAKIFEKIDKTIDSTNADKWLLVNVKEKATDFYFIGKEALKKIIKEHYRRAVETRNHTVSR